MWGKDTYHATLIYVHFNMGFSIIRPNILFAATYHRTLLAPLVDNSFCSSLKSFDAGLVVAAL